MASPRLDQALRAARRRVDQVARHGQGASVAIVTETSGHEVRVPR